MTARPCFRCLVALWLCVGVVSAQDATDLAWSILSDGLGRNSDDHRAAAAHALGLIPNNARARDAAENALNDDEEEVRASAAAALGEMGGRTRP